VAFLEGRLFSNRSEIFEYFLKSETKLKKCMKNFILQDFLIDLNEKLSKMQLDSVNINTDVDNVSSIFMSVLDKHAPLRPMSRREKHLIKKPWIYSRDSKIN